MIALVSSIGPPIAVISSVLAHFGWAQAQAEARYMGLNVALFGFTTQDYVRFSISHLFVPLICLFVTAIGWMTLNRRLTRRMEEGRGRPAARRVAGVLAIVSIAMAGSALLFVALQPGRTVLYAPYVVATGVLLAAWAERVRRLARPSQGEALSFGQRAGEAALVIGLVTLLLFWGAGDHAAAVGRRMGMDLEQHIDDLPRVELYSPKPLGIGAPSVSETKLGTDAAPLYRYDGLHLLEISGGHLFFLPNGWTARNGPVVVLKDDGTVRVEYGH